ncbi:unnamed protein product [Ostreobium quekettii]|uniref:Mitotic checkpoint regulator, MAD2B-interacting-domain-containing protein n=1 Tax=Ostreobium quekettii TaxID=121088 RepID=A0A8S1IQ46_9CHLO|nr:unnamed protein product [Ostreobium quekettii]
MSELGGLLADYGSDGDGDNSEGGPKASTATADADGDRRSAPAAGSGRPSIFSSLPEPKSSGKRLVRFMLPFDPEALRSDSDEEDDKPKKKIKLGGQASKLKDFLPPPKNAGTAEKVSDPLAVAKAAKASTMGSSAEYREDAGTTKDGSIAFGNEAFRVDNDVETAEVGPAGASDVGMPEESWEIRDARRMDDPQSHLASMSEGDRMLASTMQEEFGQAAGEGQEDPFAGLGIKFKEVKQADLTYMDPAVKESVNAANNPYGSTNAAQMRAEAAPFKASKFAKRKHQIGTLYYDMKMKEVEMASRKASGMKSKAETEAKYGWR